MGPETARACGGLPHDEVVGVAKLVPSLESLFSPSETKEKQTLSLGCAGMSQTPLGVQRVCAIEKAYAHVSAPKKGQAESKLRFLLQIFAYFSPSMQMRVWELGTFTENPQETPESQRQ